MQHKYENDKTDEGETDNVDNIGEVEIGNVGEVEIDENTNVTKHIKSFQSRIDENNERDRNREIERIENKTNLEDRERRKNDNGEAKEKQDED
eukprot:13121811-Heterocapsa_arctica.AAC.1